MYCYCVRNNLVRLGRPTGYTPSYFRLTHCLQSHIFLRVLLSHTKQILYVYACTCMHFDLHRTNRKKINVWKLRPDFKLRVDAASQASVLAKHSAFLARTCILTASFILLLRSFWNKCCTRNTVSVSQTRYQKIPQRLPSPGQPCRSHMTDHVCHVKIEQGL